MASKESNARLTAVVATRCQGVAATARAVGCSAGHLSYVLHGKRKANDTIRGRLARLGVTCTVDGVAFEEVK